MHEIDHELQNAERAVKYFGKLRENLENPCSNCQSQIKPEDCPSQQCKSDREITICQAKMMFAHAWTTLSFLTGKKVEFTETLKEDIYV